MMRTLSLFIPERHANNFTMAVITGYYHYLKGVGSGCDEHSANYMERFHSFHFVKRVVTVWRAGSSLS